MPKLKNVTADEIAAAIESAEDCGATIASIAGRIEQGYVDKIAEPIASARSFLGTGTALCELAKVLIIRAAMQESRDQLEARLREAQGKGAVSK